MVFSIVLMRFNRQIFHLRRSARAERHKGQHLPCGAVVLLAAVDFNAHKLAQPLRQGGMTPGVIEHLRPAFRRGELPGMDFQLPPADLDAGVRLSEQVLIPIGVPAKPNGHNVAV